MDGELDPALPLVGGLSEGVASWTLGGTSEKVCMLGTEMTRLIGRHLSRKLTDSCKVSLTFRSESYL